MPNLRLLQAAAKEERSKQAQLEHEAVQEHLSMMGQCPLGYDWIKDGAGGGWHCAGGAHFVSDRDLNHIYSEYVQCMAATVVDVVFIYMLIYTVIQYTYQHVLTFQIFNI